MELPGPGFIQTEGEEVLPAVLDGLGVREFAVFGHSVGGAMGIVAAAVAGARCEAVVSESPQAFVETRTVDSIKEARVRFEKPEQFERLKKWHGEKARWVLDAWTKVWLSPEFASWSLRPHLASVTSPVLVIHGDRDEYGSVASPEAIRRGVRGPVEVRELSGCGHVPHRERRDEVLSLVSHFLGSGGRLPAGVSDD